MTITSVRFVWQISVKKNIFNSANAANDAVYQAVPGRIGEVVTHEEGEDYRFEVSSTEENSQVVNDALINAGIPASIRLMRPPA